MKTGLVLKLCLLIFIGVPILPILVDVCQCVCVFPVGFLLYSYTVVRVCDIVCVPVACPCASSVGACTGTVWYR
jgi:hypothetical protein